MSDLGAIFHVKKAGVQYDAHAYTTLDECPEPNLKLKYKGQQAYVKLETKGRGDVPCYVRTKAGSVFQVKKEAVTYVNVTITQSANQTIHVYTPQKSGGTDHTSSFKIPKGTTYEAEVIPADGYTAGTLNVNAGGRINSNMTFSASGATSSVPTGSQRITVDYGDLAEITIPDGVRVVEVSGNYIGVTPNKKYDLTGWIPFIHHSSDKGEPFLRNIRSDVYWVGKSPEEYPDTIRISYTVYWSPAINAHKPDVTDY